MKFSSSAFLHVGPWRPTKPPAGWFSHGFLDFSVSCCLSWTGALPSALQLLLPPPSSAEGIFSWAVLCWRSAILSGGKKKSIFLAELLVQGFVRLPWLCCAACDCTSEFTALALVLIRKSPFVARSLWCWPTLSRWLRAQCGELHQRC